MHAEGKTIRQALRTVTGISRQLFERMCAEDPVLREMRIECARSFRESYHDLLLNIDDDPEEGRTDPKMAAVISANIKHVLAVEDPERFGNRIKVEHNITASDAIVAALQAARTRVAGMQVIDAVAVDETGRAGERTEALPAPTSAAPQGPATPAADDPFAALALRLSL